MTKSSDRKKTENGNPKGAPEASAATGKPEEKSPSNFNDYVTGSLDNMQQTMNIILQKLETSSEHQQEVRKEIYEKGGLKDQISEVQEELTNHSDEILYLKSENEKQRKEIEVLKSMVVGLAQRQESQANDITNSKSRSMKDNIVVSGFPEYENEKLAESVPKFIKEKMKINIAFDRIHRTGYVGKGRDTKSNPRVIIAHVVNPDSKDKLLSHVYSLNRDALKCEGNTIRITNQSPEEVRDQRQKLYHIKQQYAEKSVDCKIKNDKLVFSDSKAVYKDKVELPSADTIMSSLRDVKTQDKLAAITTTTGDSFTEKRNKIVSTAGHVKSYNDVRLFALKTMTENNKLSARSNVLVYRFTDEHGDKHENWINDGEYGAGQNILKVMKEHDVDNIAVVMSRWLGEHLGKVRFEVFSNNAMSAILKLINDD